MLFAVLMGTSRMFYGKYGEKIDLNRFMLCSGVLCVVSYLMISLTDSPLLGLIGCGLTGMSVGIMWPGTLSMAPSFLKNGGTTMYALFALAGDLGCSGGPTFVGMVSSAAGDDLKKGILFAILFPACLIGGVLISKGSKKSIPA